LLKTRGYATACVGKWGLGMFDTTGSPLKKGFEHFFGYNCQEHAHSYFPRYLYNDDRAFALPGNEGQLGSGVGSSLGRTYAQDLIADEALKWVRSVAVQPFFLFYALTLPHGRRQIDDLGIYRDKPWTPLQKIYAAQVSRLDADIGRLMALLKELGLDGKTLVMLAGDNGSSYSPDSEIGRHFDQSMGGRLRGYKRSLYEGGLRNAGIARWPGVVPAGRVTAEPWAFWDFLPTAAELSGAPLPAGYETDGRSLVSFLKGGPAPRRDSFYWELHEGGSNSLQAIRFGQWKAVRNGPNDATELYDLSVDAQEARNLAAAHSELVARAEALMRAARTEDPNWPLRERSGGARK
jgi:arylsulfatase A-like enzyme